MNKTLLSTAIAAVLATSAFTAMADDAPAAPPASPLSASVAVVSDYLFRGVSQTHGDPSLQGALSYSFDSGLYLGIAGDTITWVKDYSNGGTTEVDLIVGFKNAFGGGDWNYDVGVIGYEYPGHGAANSFGANPNTTEVYGALGYKEVSMKYSYATTPHFISWIGTSSNGKTNGSNYLEANWAHDLGDGWGITAHVGHQTVENLSDANYTDYNVGLTKDVGFGVVGLLVSDTDAKKSMYTWNNKDFVSGQGSQSGGYFVAKSRAVLSFTKNF